MGVVKIMESVIIPRTLITTRFCSLLAPSFPESSPLPCRIVTYSIICTSPTPNRHFCVTYASRQANQPTNQLTNTQQTNKPTNQQTNKPTNQQQTTNNKQPTTNNQQPTTNNQQQEQQQQQQQDQCVCHDARRGGPPFIRTFNCLLPRLASARLRAF